MSQRAGDPRTSEERPNSVFWFDLDSPETVYLDSAPGDVYELAITEHVVVGSDAAAVYSAAARLDSLVHRLRKRSMLRRSFFVGRPLPGSRRNNGAT